MSFFFATVDDLLPEDRKPPPGIWEAAGVEGGIPERSTICATVTDAPYNADILFSAKST